MEQEKQIDSNRDFSRLSRGKFWIGILTVWALILIVSLAGVDYSVFQGLSTFRICLLMGLTIVYCVLIVLRLKDIGWNRALVLVIFIFPLFMFIVGFMPSKEEERYKQKNP